MSDTALQPQDAVGAPRAGAVRYWLDLSLKARVALIMVATIACMVLLNYQVLKAVVQPSFDELERESALRNVVRVEKALAAEVAAMGKSVNDWAHWDDTYEFIAGQYPEYAEQLNELAFENLGIDVMYFYNAADELFLGKGFDPTTGAPFQLDALDPARKRSAQQLLDHHLAGSGIEGIVMTERGPLLVAAREIFTSEGTGPARGTLLFGRLLHEGSIAALRERVEADLQLFPLDHDLPNELRQAASQLAGNDAAPVIIPSEDELTIYTVLHDLAGAPAILVRIDTDRAISATGAQSINLAVASICVVGLVDLLLIWLILNHLVLRPLSLMHSHVLAVAETGNVDRPLPEDRTDELGVLAREYNRMLKSLAAARRQIEQQSFHEGMAESAAGALHNVRNALSPLVNQLDVLSQQLREAPGQHLDRALDELRDPATDEPRRAKLLDYLGAVAKQLLGERQAVEAGLWQATRQTVALGEILDYQDSFAYATQLRDGLEVAPLVEEAVALARQHCGPAIEIEIDPSVARASPVRGHRIGLLQVLDNVLVNAAESIVRAGRCDGLIRVAATELAGPDRPMVRLAVTDNGEGIAPDRLTAIFERGVSSKPSGRGGLGLHWCANAMTRMEGRLRAMSDGPGRGATLEIHLKRSAAA